MSKSDPNQNRLSASTSPYLLQHADNPVHWNEWNSEAFNLAKSLNKPVLLSIGYAACHWCHVMAHESFENPDIAALMNELFVNIKVDREERPDIDQIYMSAVQAMGEQGGWPLTVFLTPDAEPFWGGTYFPPVPKFGRPGFPQILNGLSHAYHNDQGKIEQNSKGITAHLKGLSSSAKSGGSAPESLFPDLIDSLLSIYDPVNGGIGAAPKFPNAPMLENLVRGAIFEGNEEGKSAFLHTMRQICNGGIYDHVGGGLSRYSVDERWLAPHFEKMLYDNAHFIRSLTWAWQFSNETLFRIRIEETVNWLKRDLLLPDGAFAASLDADSEGVEGKYYVWQHEELQEILGEDFDCFAEHYDIQQNGNWENTNIPNRLLSQIEDPQTEATLTQSREKLLAIRSQRIPPGTDDKVLTDWNGYLIRALAEASVVFDSVEFLSIAKTTYRFFSESVSTDGKLPHSHRKGQSKFPAMATDYAAMINAALSLFEKMNDPALLADCANWFGILEADYGDGNDGFYLSSVESTDLLVRPRADTDEANPGASSQILEAMVRYANIAQEIGYLDRAEKLAANIYANTRKSPYGLSGFANGLHELQNHRHLTFQVNNESSAGSLEEVMTKTPRVGVSVDRWKQNRERYFETQLPTTSSETHVIVCTRQSCSAPITEPDKLKIALGIR